MNILFENIDLVSPHQRLNKKVFLWISNGIIAHCDEQRPSVDTETTIIDAKGLVAAPGFFDMHVHLREPGQAHKETIETGTASAAYGGFTGVVCMPNTEPAIDSLQTIEYILSRAKNNVVDVHPCAAITKSRLGNDLAALQSLASAGAVMFSDDGGCVESAEVMRRAFDYGSSIDALLTQHCEEHSMTRNFAMNEGSVSAELGLKGYPSVAEDIIVARDILLAEYCGNRRYHAAHISTKGSVRLVSEAKKRGQRVSCEVAPHHFILTDEAVRGYNTNAKMNPPLRTQADVEAIWQGLADGVIDVIATDHAPHSLHEKMVEFDNAPNGIVGLETSLALTLTHLYHTKILTLEQIIERMSVNPRNVLKLTQPLIAKGSPANLSIFNPDEEWTVQPESFKTKSKNTPFGGYQLKGKAKYVFNNATMVKCD